MENAHSPDCGYSTSLQVNQLSGKLDNLTKLVEVRLKNIEDHLAKMNGSIAKHEQNIHDLKEEHEKDISILKAKHDFEDGVKHERDMWNKIRNRTLSTVLAALILAGLATVYNIAL